MTIEEFKTYIDQQKRPEGIDTVLLALWEVKSGNWGQAHRIVQNESSRMAARVHAYLHRVEGDEANAGYWYSQAGVPVAKNRPDEEWEEIVNELLCRLP